MRQQVVQRIEADRDNRRPVRFGEAITIARVLGISLDELVLMDTEATTSEALREAGYQTDRAVRGVEDQVRSLRAAQDNHANVIERANSLDVPEQSVAPTTDPNANLNRHVVQLNCSGPAYVAQRQVIRDILSGVGRASPVIPDLESVEGDAGDLIDWVNCLRAAWVIIAFDSPRTAHVRLDAERFAMLRDALAVVESLNMGYDHGIKELRTKGYWLDDQILRLSGLDGMREAEEQF